MCVYIRLYIYLSIYLDTCILYISWLAPLPGWLGRLSPAVWLAMARILPLGSSSPVLVELPPCSSCGDQGLLRMRQPHGASVATMPTVGYVGRSAVESLSFQTLQDEHRGIKQEAPVPPGSPGLPAHPGLLDGEQYLFSGLLLFLPRALP